MHVIYILLLFVTVNNSVGYEGQEVTETRTTIIITSFTRTIRIATVTLLTFVRSIDWMEEGDMFYLT